MQVIDMYRLKIIKVHSYILDISKNVNLNICIY